MHTLVFSHADRLMIETVRNLLTENHIDYTVKNEYLSGAMGEIPFFECWPEIWVRKSHSQLAEEIIKNYLSLAEKSDWICPKCGEANAASFEICWLCGTLSV